MTSPGRRALATAAELVRALAGATQVYGLYDAGHPNRRETVREALERCRELRRDSAGDPVLFVTRHSLYLGPTLLARESLSLFRLVEAAETAGIEAVEILPGVSEEDLDALVRMLTGEVAIRTPLGGLAINRVRPDIDDVLDNDATDLRRRYGVGLELLRETEVRAAAGRPVDLDATATVVTDMASQVLRDPGRAMLLTTVRSYDEYSYYHMVNVCLLSMALGHAVGLSNEQVVALGMGALLHDIGKLHVPREVLNHVGPLSEEQWRIVQRHPVDGAGLVLSTADGLYHPAAPVVLEHHASFDLSGYPPLSERPAPSLPARLVAVADCFDAITSDRSYRRAEERREALSVLVAGAGRGFDPAVVRSFIRLLGVFPVGSLVRLSDGELAVVVRVNDDLTRPVVRRVLDARGEPAEPDEIDLAAIEDTEVVTAVVPSEVGIDVPELLTTGRLQSPTTPLGGLVHEPAPSERPPPGYVHGHDGPPPQLEGRPDPDVAPPWPDQPHPAPPPPDAR